MEQKDFHFDRSPPKYFFGIFGILLLIVFSWTIKDEMAIFDHGERMLVTDIAVKRRSFLLLSMFDATSWYTAQVTYRTRTSTETSGNLNFPRPELEKLKKRQELFVYYLPERPRVVSFSKSFPYEQWLTLVFPLIMFYLQFLHLRNLRRAEAKT